MAETASQTITIAAPPDRVWDIATDLERYPEWAKDVKDVVVRARDDHGRPLEVEFRASALGRSTHYTLSYDYSDAPAVLAWRWCAATSCAPSTVRTTSRRQPMAAPRCATTSSSSSSCRLPGFVKRRAEVRILNTVRELKVRAES